jgi:hypothetical protein
MGITFTRELNEKISLFLTRNPLNVLESLSVALIFIEIHSAVILYHAVKNAMIPFEVLTEDLPDYTTSHPTRQYVPSFLETR